MDEEGRQRFDPSGLHQRARLLPERPAGRQPIGGAPAEVHRRQRAAEGPEHARAGRLAGERGEVEHRVHRRVAAAHHQRRGARVGCPGGAEHVGDAVRDAVRAGGFPRRGQAVRPGRARARPRAGGVDHRARLDLDDPAIGGGDVQDEGRGCASEPGGDVSVAQAVVVAAGNADHACAEPQVGASRGQRGGQRFDVARHEVGAGRVVVRLGRLPARWLRGARAPPGRC